MVSNQIVRFPVAVSILSAGELYSLHLRHAGCVHAKHLPFRQQTVPSTGKTTGEGSVVIYGGDGASCEDRRSVCLPLAGTMCPRFRPSQPTLPAKKGRSKGNFPLLKLILYKTNFRSEEEVLHWCCWKRFWTFFFFVTAWLRIESPAPKKHGCQLLFNSRRQGSSSNNGTA